MNIDGHVAALNRQLADAAALGGTEMVELAERLASPLQAAVRLVLQDVLSEAMQELTLELAPGSAEMRLRGRDVDFVVNRPWGAAPAGADAHGEAARGNDDGAMMAPSGLPDDGIPDVSGEPGTARISFRPPDWLKAQIEAAAERQGLSVNAFLVRTLTAALRPAPQRPAATDPGTPQGRDGARLEGWVF